MRFSSRIRRLRPQRELRGREGAVPRAAHAHSLRAPGDAHRARQSSRGGRARDSRRARRDRDRTTCGQAAYDSRCEDLFFFVERLIVERCGEDAAGRLHTARSRNDIDMTMYRMQQREHDPRAVRRVGAPARRAARSGRRASRGRVRRAHAHAAGAAHRRSPTTCTPSSNSSSATRVRLRARTPTHEPESARRVRDHGDRLPDRSHTHERAARVRRPDGQHLRQHRDRRLPAGERVGGGGAARRARARRAGPAAVVHERVRLPAARRRVRPVQQHHAAEAQPGRAGARARDRQQGARAGERDPARPSTTRRSATSSTPRTICSRSSSRCSPTPSARCAS